MKWHILVGAICTLPAAHAAVLDSAAGGFTVKDTVTVHAAPAAAYDAFVHKIGEWWDSRHTFSQDAHNLSIDDKPMGCFCEKLPDNGGVRHMEVVRVSPGKTLVMLGALGPLQTRAAIGTMVIEFATASSGTTVTMQYAVAGYLPAGMNTWAAPVDGVISQQLHRLENYIDTGSPAPKSATTP